MTTLVNLSTQSYATLTAMDGDKYYLYQTPLLARDPFLERAEEAAEKSEGARDEARIARDKAKQWADNPEDLQVETGLYSAKHHAIKSGKSATASENSNKASGTSAAASGTSAAASEASKQESAAAAAAALTSKNLSQEWAIKPENQVVAESEYSSKHYSIKSKKEADKAKESETNAGNSAAAAADSAAMLEFPFEDQGNFDPRGGNLPAKPGFSALWYCVAAYDTPGGINWGVGDYLCYSKKNDRFSQLTGDPIDPGEQQPFEVPDDLHMQPDKALRFKRSPNDPDPIYAVGMRGDHTLIYGDIDDSESLEFWSMNAANMWAVESVDANFMPTVKYKMLTEKNGVPKSGGVFNGQVTFDENVVGNNDVFTFGVDAVKVNLFPHVRFSKSKLLTEIRAGDIDTDGKIIISPSTNPFNKAGIVISDDWVTEISDPRSFDAQGTNASSLTRKDYVNSQDATTLASGKTYTDQQVATRATPAVVDQKVKAHEDKKTNPHGVTAAQVGAVNKSGDTITGNLIFAGSQKLESNKDGVRLDLIRQGGSEGQPITVVGDNSNDSTYIYSGAGGISFNHATVRKLSTESYGVAIHGQLAISSDAPTTSNHATRKDYVDNPSPSVWSIDYGRI